MKRACSLTPKDDSSALSRAAGRTAPLKEVIEIDSPGAPASNEDIDHRSRSHSPDRMRASPARLNVRKNRKSRTFRSSRTIRSEESSIAGVSASESASVMVDVVVQRAENPEPTSITRSRGRKHSKTRNRDSEGLFSTQLSSVFSEALMTEYVASDSDVDDSSSSESPATLRRSMRFETVQTPSPPPLPNGSPNIVPATSVVASRTAASFAAAGTFARLDRPTKATANANIASTRTRSSSSPATRRRVVTSGVKASPAQVTKSVRDASGAHILSTAQYNRAYELTQELVDLRMQINSTLKVAKVKYEQVMQLADDNADVQRLVRELQDNGQFGEFPDSLSVTRSDQRRY